MQSSACIHSSYTQMHMGRDPRDERERTETVQSISLCFVICPRCVHIVLQARVRETDPLRGFECM